MNSKLYIAFALCFVGVAVSAQNKQWSLQQCVDTAVTHNRTVKQQTIETQNRELAYEQARNNLLPTLSAGATHNLGFGRTLGENNTYSSGGGTTITNSTSVGLSASLELYTGNRRRNDIKLKKADSEASKADLDKIKNNIATNVAAAYLQVLLNKELVRVADEQLGLTKTRIEQRKALVQSGKMAEGEMLELVAQQAKEELSRTQSANNLKLALLDLAQLLEIDNFESLDVEAPENLSEKDFVLLTADAVYASALQHRPEIKGAESRLQSSQYSLAIAKAGYLPTLSLSGSLGSSYFVSNIKNYDYSGNRVPYDSFGKQMSDKFNGGFTLSLNIPIFDRFATRTNVRSAQLGIQSSRVAIDNARIELRKTIQQAYFNALAANSRWQSAQKSVAANQEAFRFANQKYEAGRANVYELYQAKNNLSQAQSELLQSKYEYLFRVKLLEYLK